MNRNSNEHFSSIPQIDIDRSRFDRSFSLKTTFSSGKLIPIMFDEVLPGDTITLDTSVVCRMTTPIFPIMDNCYLDVYYFFVPNRLVWNSWKAFMGEDTTNEWETMSDYEVPSLIPFAFSEDGKDYYKFSAGSLADYFGLPVEEKFTEQFRVNSFPFRAYYLIWNEYFRAQAVQSEVQIPGWDVTFPVLPLSEYHDQDYSLEAFQHLALMPVGKFHDYFTSCLPSPQRGQPVMLPFNGQLPILTSSDKLPINELNDNFLYGINDEGEQVEISNGGSGFIPSNLYADLSRSDFISVNDLRSAIVVQQFLEMESRGGSRYTEIIKTFFGVTSPDARLQRPEYLGGKKIPINIDQVVQTSASDSQPSPLGSTAAFSLTGDVDNSFTYSATEHGMIIGLCCVRPNHTYQRGIEKKWLRSQRFDYYFPVFANISEQPVFTKELVATEGVSSDDVFGYQEAWAEYRYNQNRVTGGFRYNAPDSLSPWVYTDTSSTSVISDAFIREDPNIIKETLAYQGNNDVQFLADFYFQSIWIRPMPVYSLPGLTRL